MKYIILLLLLLPSTAYADSLEIHLQGLTIHGFQNTGDVSKRMPRKIDDNGQAVLTPGFAIAWNKNDWIFSQSFVKDCYDNFASSTLFGRQWNTKIPNLTLQFLGGVYIRERPLLCIEGVCFEAVDIPWKIRSTLGNNDIDIIPMAFGGINYRQSLGKRAYLHVNLFTNVVLTHFTTGIGWDF